MDFPAEVHNSSLLRRQCTPTKRLLAAVPVTQPKAPRGAHARGGRARLVGIAKSDKVRVKRRGDRRRNAALDYSQ